jgi:hypothetical protein
MNTMLEPAMWRSPAVTVQPNNPTDLQGTPRKGLSGRHQFGMPSTYGPATKRESAHSGDRGLAAGCLGDQAPQEVRVLRRLYAA